MWVLGVALLLDGVSCGHFDITHVYTRDEWKIQGETLLGPSGGAWLFFIKHLVFPNLNKHVGFAVQLSMIVGAWHKSGVRRYHANRNCKCTSIPKWNPYDWSKERYRFRYQNGGEVCHLFPPWYSIDMGEWGNWPWGEAKFVMGSTYSKFHVGIFHVREATLYTNAYAIRIEVITSCTTFRVYRDEYLLAWVDADCCTGRHVLQTAKGNHMAAYCYPLLFKSLV